MTLQESLQFIPSQWHEEFKEFIENGVEPSIEFSVFLDTDVKAQKALSIILSQKAEEVQKLVAEFLKADITRKTFRRMSEKEQTKINEFMYNTHGAKPIEWMDTGNGIWICRFSAINDVPKLFMVQYSVEQQFTRLLMPEYFPTRETKS